MHNLSDRLLTMLEKDGRVPARLNDIFSEIRKLLLHVHNLSLSCMRFFTELLDGDEDAQQFKSNCIRSSYTLSAR